MAFNIETIQGDEYFNISPYDYLDLLFKNCKDDTLIIPIYPEEDSSHPACYDYYEMYWSEEDCKNIKEAFANLQSELKTIASDGYDEVKVLSAVKKVDSNPDYFVTLYAKRLCKLMRYKAPEIMLTDEAVKLIVSMAANKCSKSYFRVEGLRQSNHKSLRQNTANHSGRMPQITPESLD